MPIYEYVCRQCGAEFEELIRSAGDEKKLRCEKCDGSKVERKLSVPAAPHAAASAPPSPCGGCGTEPGSCPFQQ